jgi:hypothetical protein
MKYVRYLIYFLFYAAITAGGLWLFGLVRGRGFPLDIGRLARLLVPLGVLALMPLFKALNKKKTAQLPKIEGLKSSALSLECRYKGFVALEPAALKSTLKEVCESLLFPDRYLELSFEDEGLLEYATMPREDEVETGRRRRRKSAVPASIVSLELAAEGSGSTLSILSKSENLFSTLDNEPNEEHVSAIVGALFQRGLVGDPRIQ